MADIEFRQGREERGMPKEEGTDHDANAIVAGLRRGLSLEEAANRLPIAVKWSWIEKNETLFRKWAKEGRPASVDNVSGRAKKPIDHIVKDGKVFAIYSDHTMIEVKDTTVVKK